MSGGAIWPPPLFCKHKWLFLANKNTSYLFSQTLSSSKHTCTLLFHFTPTGPFEVLHTGPLSQTQDEKGVRWDAKRVCRRRQEEKTGQSSSYSDLYVQFKKNNQISHQLTGRKDRSKRLCSFCTAGMRWTSLQRDFRIGYISNNVESVAVLVSVPSYTIVMDLKITVWSKSWFGETQNSSRCTVCLLMKWWMEKVVL